MTKLTPGKLKRILIMADCYEYGVTYNLKAMQAVWKAAQGEQRDFVSRAYLDMWNVVCDVISTCRVWGGEAGRAEKILQDHIDKVLAEAPLEGDSA